MRGSSELAPRLGEASYDVAIYRRVEEAIPTGKAPCRDFFIEYPPQSLPVFVPPALFSSSREGYVSLFASKMALALVAALLPTACASRPWPLFPAAVFASGATLLYPVAVIRYDRVEFHERAGNGLLDATQNFPFHYLEISAGRPGTDILLGRNLLLLVLWGLMLSLPEANRQNRRRVPCPR